MTLRQNIRTYIWKAIAVLAGALLMARLIHQVGWGVIARAFSTNAPALIAITVVYVVYHLLRTITLRICIPHPTDFQHLFGIRLAGEAIAYLAVGSIVGDAIKVGLARKRVPVVEGATGVFAEKLIYHLAGAAFIAGGLLAALLKLSTSHVLIYSLLAMGLFFAGLFFLLSSGAQPVAWLLKRIPERRKALRDTILKTEESLFQFRTQHPRQFVIALLLNIASYFYSVLEVLFLLYVFGIHASFWNLWYYQAIVKMSNTTTFVMPANLGIFESVNILLARQLRFGEDIGMILALFVRTRAIIWSIIGYLWFAYYMTRAE